ncbi:MAG: response regulator RpfG family c-di-GMP phosphodiesterase [Myxococcota bacterium]|jgi:response regulator RpfG family c-di-GMP phosphodiesterase
MGEVRSPRILCVDDEPKVLEGLENSLGWDFDVDTATCGAEGLERLRNEGVYEVVISDMRMPRMNGAQFLSAARLLAPDTTRMLLTGYAEVEAAAAAINEGAIFRFLTKPCTKDALKDAVNAACAQHRLITGERDLLENTLQGAIKMLSEVLGLTAPAAFRRASAVKEYVAFMAAALGLEDAWQFEVAALLSRLGCIAMPSVTLEKMLNDQPLIASEEMMVADQARIGRALLSHVPRLQQAAAMIGRQNQVARIVPSIPLRTPASAAMLGGAMIRLALAVDQRVLRGTPFRAALADVEASNEEHPELLLSLLRDYQRSAADDIVIDCTISQLVAGMVLEESIETPTKTIVVMSGSIVSNAMLERLRNFVRGVGVREPIRVRIPG